MDAAARDFLFRLLETPSPSGYERPVQELVREYLAGVADSVTSDAHGNVIGGKNTASTPRVLLVGHCDQIGLIVQHEQLVASMGRFSNRGGRGAAASQTARSERNSEWRSSDPE